jgi:hypothetical protein
MRSKRITKEEKVAKTIIESVNDFTLDLDSVGRYIAEQSNSVLYNRLDVVADSARESKEELHDRIKEHSIFQTL